MQKKLKLGVNAGKSKVERCSRYVNVLDEWMRD